MKTNLDITRDELQRLYWGEDLDAFQIAELKDVSYHAVWHRMIKYNIPRRGRSEAARIHEIDRERVKNLYWEQKLSIHKIAGILGVSGATVYRCMINNRVPLRSRSEAEGGQMNPFYGKTHSLDAINKLSGIAKNRRLSLETRRKISIGNKGKKLLLTHKMRISEANAKRVINKTHNFLKENRTPEFIEKCHKGRFKRPTRPEERIIRVIIEGDFPFKYTGDGSFLLEGLNPDFVSNKLNKIIEVFGRVFHDPSVSFIDIPLNRQYEGRMVLLKKLGYDCLIFWDDELKEMSNMEIASKIRGFCYEN